MGPGLGNFKTVNFVGGKKEVSVRMIVVSG